MSLSFISRTLLFLTLLTIAAVRPLHAQTAVLDTFSIATNFTFSGTEPRTYMGDAFPNNSLPAGTTSFQITSLTIYLGSVAAANYNNIVDRIQFYNTVTPTAANVFSNPAGPLLTINLGPLVAAANSFYTFNVTLATPITLIGGAGTNWGFVRNFQGDTGTGLADNTNLTSLITYNVNGGYAAGQITTGTAPTRATTVTPAGKRVLTSLPPTPALLAKTAKASASSFAAMRSSPSLPPQRLVLSGAGLAFAAVRARRRV